jgi:asparagine synthase (glutamine-hydrolysing)
MSELLAAIAALSHRGPDDSGVFENLVDEIGLAHARLAILDLSPSGHQPMQSPDGSVVLVFNGEVYNYRELRRELESEGRVFKGGSDTEVLLHLYLDSRSRGTSIDEMLRRINGMFSLAFWDSTSKSLVLARDALGIKPLYYSTVGDRVVFGSEIKALIPFVPSFGEPDPTAVDRYLSFLLCPGSGTPVRTVRKLGPGELLIIRRGRIDFHRQWYCLPSLRSVSVRRDEDNLAREIAIHLRQAVHRQMVSDVPVGAFLSGGVDSSSVVAFAREENPDIRCFTIETQGGVDDGVIDDLPYARIVATHLGVPLEVVRIDAQKIAEDLEAMVYQLDEPLADPASLNVLYISRRARESGVKVLLSGCGADDLFTGYRRHRALQLESLWKWLPVSLRRQVTCLAQGLDQRRTAGRRLRKLLDVLQLEGDARLVNYFRWNRREDLKNLYSSDFRVAMEKARVETPMEDFLNRLPPELPPLGRMLALDQRFFLADHNLIYTDKMSMACGVEVRVPFLDLDLVEFAQSISLELKQRSSEGKWILKKAMESYLPRDIIYRQKTGFGAPLRRWMRSELREMLGEILSEKSVIQRGIFDPVAVRRLVEANDAGRTDASYTLFSLMCMELWFRRFIDLRPQRPRSS